MLPPSGRRFRVVLADPPWSFADKITMSKVRRGAASQYATMGLQDLKQLHAHLAPLLEDDALLTLWFVSCQAAEALALMRCWGFVQKQIWTWEKTKKDGTGQAFGMGRLARGCTEHLFVGTRGKVLKHVRDHTQRTSFRHPALPHSQKPDNVHQMLDLMFPGERKLELFARRPRPIGDWTCLGNQCEGDGQDIRVSLQKLQCERS
jgi:N6-adenosine-specific RNA methylase IME4